MDDNYDAYYYHIKTGDYHYKNGQIRAAQDSYNNALKIYGTSHKGNLGLTKCLMWNCINLNVYCEEANVYYNLMKDHKYTNSEEEKELQKLYRDMQRNKLNLGFSPVVAIF